MKNELLIIKERNFTALLFFVVIFLCTFTLMQVDKPSAVRLIYIFHIIQYIIVLVFFQKQFEINNAKSKIKWILFFLTLLLTFFLFYLSVFLFSLLTLMPILFIFITEFLIGKNLFDENKYIEREKVLNILKNKGSISESEFKIKMSELIELKRKTEVILSITYIKLLKELKKGTISQKEINDYVLNEINKVDNNSPLISKHGNS